MKGAYLLSKNAAFFAEFERHLRHFEYQVDVADNSLKLTLDNGRYLLFYDCLDGKPFEEHEFPSEASLQGYSYAFLVECRSEELFCTIVGSSPPNLDFLVCDSDGQLYLPNELSPDTVVL